MTELVTSPAYRAYLNDLIAGLDRAMEIANKAKSVGVDSAAVRGGSDRERSCRKSGGSARLQRGRGQDPVS